MVGLECRCWRSRFGLYRQQLTHELCLLFLPPHQKICWLERRISLLAHLLDRLRVFALPLGSIMDMADSRKHLLDSSFVGTMVFLLGSFGRNILDSLHQSTDLPCVSKPMVQRGKLAYPDSFVLHGRILLCCSDDHFAHHVFNLRREEKSL